jgi:predicted regulator of Ras-like GTPase activity (Roadblock/LC7/MglB family)
MSSPSTTTTSAPSLKAHFATIAPAPLSAHITDATGHVILSSGGGGGGGSSLKDKNKAALSHAFISAHDTASRMGLGEPLRVTITTQRGTVVMQTGSEAGEGGEMVVGTVVAPEDKMAEARVASWSVQQCAERVGRVIGEGRRGQERS